MRGLRLTIVAAVFASWSAAMAIEMDEDYAAVLRDGVVFGQTKRWALAGDYWARQAQTFKDDDDVPGAQLGLLYVLETISYEKADDSRAYQAWANAISSFLQSGSSWTQYRGYLLGEINDVNFQIGSSFSPEGLNVAGGTRNALVVQSIDSLYHITRYEGPRPGLTVRKAPDETAITVARSYFPRPGGADNTGDTDNRSRSLAPAELVEEAEPSGVSRGFRVESGLDDYVALDDLDDPMIDPPTASPSVGVTELTLSSLEPEADAAVQEAIVEAGAAQAVEEIAAARAETAVEAPLITRRIAGDGLRVLSEEELEIGRRAWRYFASNRQTNTGLFNSVHNYPFTTIWDLGSSLAALHSAHAIGVIDDNTFNEQLRVMLNTLKDMPLYDGALPNREYDTRSGLMTNFNNAIDDIGTGFSALDIGRALTWLAIIRDAHGEHAPAINAIVGGWRLDRAVLDQQLYRDIRFSGPARRDQEGRLGYEQYAALAFSHWGVDVRNALDVNDTEEVLVEGVPVLRDTREPDFLNLEPFLMTLLEYDRAPLVIGEQASALIATHMFRAERSGEIYLFSEDSIDREPWFLYNVISAPEGDFVCKTFRGELQENCQRVSTKAAFVANALFDLDFLGQAYSEVAEGFDIRNGYYSGIYTDNAPNRALTSNTNAMILESLAYKLNGGPFLKNEFEESATQSRSRGAN